ncbi:hypothetical protein Hte_008457 [Hypoxylon texense]
MAPICKFWQQGYCKNGESKWRRNYQQLTMSINVASCRFEHTNANANPFASNSNRFSALNPGGSSNNNSNHYKPQENPYKITKDSIKTDLSDERPQWILSCYGPGKDAPEQLFGGYPREQSLEEVMLYIRGSGNEQQAWAEVTGLYQQAEQQIQTTLNNLDGAMQFVLAAENKHPNRIDICKQASLQGGTTGLFARDAAGPRTNFPNPLSSNSNAFSSVPQQSQNPFASGGSGGGGTPAFGQPSALGQKPNPFASTSSPAFGQPSALGAPKPAFGQPSQMGANAPAFGQPSALGQKPNPFSNTAASASTGFGQAAVPTAPSAFGQPSALGPRPNPFSAAVSSGPSPFSQATVPAPPSAPNPFGRPAAANPFAQAPSAPAPAPPYQSMDTSVPAVPATSNPFAQPSRTPVAPQLGNVFGAQPPSGFGAVANNPFAQASTQPQAPAATAANNNPYAPNSTKQHPAPDSYITKATTGQITSFNGQPVIYKWKVQDKYQDQRPPGYDSKEPPVPGVRNADGTWRKIFFPSGPPGYNKDTEPDIALYDASVKAAYATMTSTGKFAGDMPEVPPLREDCVWNF